MLKFFIHIRDSGVLYEDLEGIAVDTIDDLRPHIEQVVAELIETEGPVVIDGVNVVEVTDERGQLVHSDAMTSFFSKQ